MGIKGHVDYSAVRKEPKPPAPAVRHVVVTSARPTPTPSTPLMDFLKYLRGICKAEERCPTNIDLKMRFPNANKHMKALIADGLLRVYVYMHNWRVIEIDGVASAPPPGKRYHPYLRIDKGGRFYWDGQGWRAR